MVAPHQSIKVGGKEVSGTVMRDLLGSPKIDDKERPKLFKQEHLDTMTKVSLI